MFPRRSYSELMSLDGSLPDEVVHSVFSFMYGVELLDVAALFRKVLPLSSKRIILCLYDYVRNTPLTVFHNYDRFVSFRMGAVAWACRRRVKLKECRFECRTLLDFRVLEHVLRQCDITQLERLDLFTSQDRRPPYVEESVAATNQGFPFDVVYKACDMHRYVPGAGDEDFERCLAEYVPKHAQSVQKMNLAICHTSMSLLTSFSHSLEDLTLTNTGNGQYNDSLAGLIEELPKLNSLILVKFSGSFKIKSNSLSQICTKDCLAGFFVNECICPNLEVFYCGPKAGIRPVTPFQGRFPYGYNGSRYDIKDSRFEEDWYHCITILAGSHRFRGTVVPDSCAIVYMQNASTVPTATASDSDTSSSGSDLDSESDSDYEDSDRSDSSDDTLDLSSLP
jgi:hypothetical protein